MLTPHLLCQLLLSPKLPTKTRKLAKSTLLFKQVFYGAKELVFSLFLSASIWSPESFIPHPAVFSDNITGRRPRLAENDKLRANGWSSDRNIS
jgi:hypothetical protein